MCERRHHTSLDCGLADFLRTESGPRCLQNRLSSLTNHDHYLTLRRFL